MIESGELGKSESVKYTYDKNGNLLSEVAARYRKDYVYNAQNRMIFSDVQDAFLNTRNLTEYAYDAFGRRIETIEYLGDHTRNLYDGFSFDVVGKTLLQTRSAPAMTEQKYRAGSAGHPELGSGSAAGRSGAGVANGTRYRYIGDEPLKNAGSAGAGNTGAQASSSANGAKTRSRPNSEYVLYAYGEPVAMSADGDTSYFGTDILGSVRSVTDKYGNVKASYEYDAFGTPYLSNLDNGMSFGYTGKIFDSDTGLYDYGFRDYSPNSARFTTVDPVRDGANWFSYVVNDPVNYIDPFGLTSTDAGSGNSINISTSDNISNNSTAAVSESTNVAVNTGTTLDSFKNEITFTSNFSNLTWINSYVPEQYKSEAMKTLSGSFAQIATPYNSWTQQNPDWGNKSLYTTQDKNGDAVSITIAKEGCKLTAAAKMVSSIGFWGQQTPFNLIDFVDQNGNLSQDAIIKGLKANLPENYDVIADVWEKKLNVDTLVNIRNNPNLYVIAKAELGDNLGIHYVNITGYSVDNDGNIFYEVSGTSDNDKGRVYSSLTPTNKNKGKVLQIQTFEIIQR